MPSIVFVWLVATWLGLCAPGWWALVIPVLATGLLAKLLLQEYGRPTARGK